MTRETIFLTLPDVSAFARTLKSDLGTTSGDAAPSSGPLSAPSHQSLLNAIARAGGYRNFQHLKATQTGSDPVAPAEGRVVTRALLRFDAQGLMTSWSTKRKLRQYCLWALWAQVPSRTAFSEREISDLFDTMTMFRDAAQIRRSLIEDGRMDRNRDGSRYMRVEARPDETALAVIKEIRRRRQAHSQAPDRVSVHFGM